MAASALARAWPPAAARPGTGATGARQRPRLPRSSRDCSRLTARAGPPDAEQDPRAQSGAPGPSGRDAAAASEPGVTPAPPGGRSLQERWGEQLLARGQEAAMRVTVGARRGTVGAHFAGGFLGADSDIASGALRRGSLSSLAHLADAAAGVHVPPRFAERVQGHVVKNYYASAIDGAVPLILGIWGTKGQGKSFQLAVTCARLGLQPVFMAAGEMEDVRAGAPGRRLRQRYREAVAAAAGGQLSALVLHDLDVGAGRFKHSQMTVNNQNLLGTLMSLCDDPAERGVRAPPGGGLGTPAADAGYVRRVTRVPIIVTANDLSTLYAPLLRDGRMDKFLWAPEEAERREVLRALLPEPPGAAEALAEAFPHQPIDFFAALCGRMADGAVRAWLRRLAGAGGGAGLGAALSGSLGGREPPPRVEPPPPTLAGLLAAGNDLAREQREVQDRRLSKEYFKESAPLPLRQRAPEPPAAPAPLTPEQAAAEEAARGEAREAIREAMAEAEAARIAYEASLHPPEEAPPAAAAEEAAAVPWARLSVQAAREALFGAAAASDPCMLIDVRPAKEADRVGTIKGARGVPAVRAEGFLSDARDVELPTFEAAAEKAAKGGKAAALLVMCNDGGGRSRAALGRLAAAGFTSLRLMEGGFDAWEAAYTPAGGPRVVGAFKDTGPTTWSDS